MPLEHTGFSLVAMGGGAADFAITADGTRGLVLYQASNKLLTVDLEALKPVLSVATGRGGIKFGKFMGAMALSMASGAAGATAASSSGSSYYTYRVYRVGDPNTLIALRPDGRFAYILNTQTNDVTVVATNDGTIVDKIPGGGTSLRLLREGKVLSVVGDSIRLIDTEENKPSAGAAIEHAVSLQVSPDSTYAVVLLKKSLTLLDGETGRVVTQADQFKHPIQVVFGVDPVVGPPATQRFP